MIDAILFAIVAFVIFWVAAWVGEQAAKTQTTVTCRCGRERVRRAICLDAHDRERVAKMLSLLCPFCRSAARNARPHQEIASARN